MKLYDFPKCPYCRKVRVALEEKGIDYERIFVDLSKGDQKSEEFLELNPYGKVPVLVDGETVVYESTVINQYLEEKYPEPPLMPEEPEHRARVRILVDFCESHFNDPWLNLYKELNLKKEAERDEDLIRSSRNELTKHLSRLNNELVGREYLAGDYSLADIAYTPRVAVLDPLGVQLDSKLAHLIAWIERIKTRQSYEALEL